MGEFHLASFSWSVMNLCMVKFFDSIVNSTRVVSKASSALVVVLSVIASNVMNDDDLWLLKKWISEKNRILIFGLVLLFWISEWAKCNIVGFGSSFYRVDLLFSWQKFSSNQIDFLVKFVWQMFCVLVLQDVCSSMLSCFLRLNS